MMVFKIVSRYAQPRTIPVGPKYVIDKIFDSSKTYEAQREVAVELIKKGKENGVDEMEITMENNRGGKFNIPVDDVKIDASVGTDEKLHVRVKYK